MWLSQCSYIFFIPNCDVLASQLGSVPTPAALKAGVGFPLGFKKQGIVHRGKSSLSKDTRQIDLHPTFKLVLNSTE